MADKTIDIELKTTADTSGATSVKDVLAFQILSLTSKPH